MRDDEILGRFTEVPLPVSGVDVHRAIRAGRRHRRARVAATVAVAVTLLLGGGGLAAPVWLGGPSLQPGEAGPTPPPSHPPCVSPGPSASGRPSAEPDGRAPYEFDILRRWITVGSLDGLELDASNTARYWQYLLVHDQATGMWIEIAVFAGGGDPQFADPPGSAPRPVDLTQGTPAEPVAGHPAFWLDGRQGIVQLDAARLAWEWAGGGWAFVAVANRNQPDGVVPTTAEMAGLRSRAREVAGSLQIGDVGAVTMPFSVSVPACARLNRTSLMSSTDSADKPFHIAGLHFGRIDDSNPLSSAPDAMTTVSADSGSRQGKPEGTVTDTVDGHLATVGTGSVTMYDVAGYRVEINTAFGSPDEALASARSLRVIPGAYADQSLWTDHPLTVP